MVANRVARLFSLSVVLVVLCAACGRPQGQAAGPETSADSGSLPGSALLYTDDFSNPDSGWPVDDTYYFRGYADGAYRIRIDQDENLYIFPVAVSGHSFGDVRVEVDTRRVSGSESAGIYLVCRYRDNDNYYYAELDGEGLVTLGAYHDNEQQILVDDLPTAVTADANHLRLDCSGSQMTFYIDGTQVANAGQLDSAAGDVGFGAGGSGSGVTEVLFDNFTVSQP